MSNIRLTTEKDKMAVIGKRIVDRDGFELGFVGRSEVDTVIVSEGLFDKFVLSLDLVESLGDDIILKGSLITLLVQSKVYDSEDKLVGTVIDVIEAGDTLDTLIVRTRDIPEDEDMRPEDLAYVLLEEISDIEWKKIWLNVPSSELKLHEPDHPLREVVFERIRYLFR